MPSNSLESSASIRVNANVSPPKRMQTLSRDELTKICDARYSSQFAIFRQCALAVLNCGSNEDQGDKVLDTYKDFRIELLQREKGIKLQLYQAPADAFVNGEMIEGIRENLFAVLRDILFVHTHFLSHVSLQPLSFSSDTQEKKLSENDPVVTDLVFNILRNADVLIPSIDPNLIVCWGGHSISRSEYDFTKHVGYQLGLRRLDICTGCGPGAMKGPMKGATIAHAKQRFHGRYVGISEPGIIAAESPNPIVNSLVTMPDIEKRLESFVRLAHGVIVFPGGVGTAEEVFYLLALLLHEKNRDIKLPVVFAASKEQAGYFEALNDFIGATLGEQAKSLYTIVIEDDEAIARYFSEQMESVKRQRVEGKDAFYFNWLLHIPSELQKPFDPTHENMAALVLNSQLSAFDLAVNMRAMFSGIVAGNVKAEGLRSVREKGKFQINAEKQLTDKLDRLLRSFVEQGRMKIDSDSYQPCYEVVCQA